jgi:PII-like signaling protein
LPGACCPGPTGGKSPPSSRAARWARWRSGATTQRGIWGFHGDHAPHGDRLLQLGRHVPAVTVVVDTPGRIAAAFSVIDELTTERGLVTCETIPALRAGAALDGDGARAEARR